MKKIVIVGGGAAGLELVINLYNKFKKQNVSIVLIDKSLSHVWKPLLHEVAAGTLTSELDEIDFTSFIFNMECEYVYGKCVSLDRQAKTIEIESSKDIDGNMLLPARKLSYDILVFSVGSKANDFNIPGVTENCFYIDSLYDARYFHNKVLNTIIKKTQGFNNKSTKFIIVGGGATGIELAAELQQVFKVINKYGISTVKSSIKITIIEAADRLLSGLSQKISLSVKHQLEKMNIKILTNTKIIQANKNFILTSKNEKIVCDLCVWAAGVKSRLETIYLDGLKVNKNFQLKVFHSLQSIDDENIFALGDCAECPMDNANEYVPPRAQAAHQQASFLADSLVNYIKQKPLKHFKYKDYGSIINISKVNAHGTLMGKVIGNYYLQGKIARGLYWSLYQKHLIKLYGLWKVILRFIGNIFISKSRQRLKLH